MYILKRQQILHSRLESVWDFLKDPHNLNAITPDDLQFKIVSDVPTTMYNGLIIEYQIQIPLIGRQKWITEIKHIRENHSFVDEQRLGPYKFWFHHHQIDQTDNGVKSCDTVYYQPPFGPAGRLVNRFFIAKTLDRIFDYRREKLQEIFSS